MVSGDLHVIGSQPSTQELIDALVETGRLLDRKVCWYYADRFHFPLGGGWTIALSADSAGRIAVEKCRLCRPMSKLWVGVRDRARLASVVGRMNNDVAELV